MVNIGGSSESTTDALKNTFEAIRDQLDALIGNTVVGKCQIFTKNITSAANANAVTVATVTTQPCFIESIVLRSNGATTADLTSIAITGGASGVVTFLSAVEGVRANIAAADQQICWEGSVTLAATKTIVITLVGTGATAVDLQVDIKYRPIVAGGTLA
jgi:flagellin-like hook-associated protein FlgL